MKERPILFSAPMVRALLDGSKTQTRRVCKPAEKAALSSVVEVPDPLERGQVYNGSHFGNEEGGVQFASPYGGVGERLYVRETFSALESVDFFNPAVPDDIPSHWYWADGNPEWGDWTRPKPSIHMPRAASRIDLKITGVRVERLQDISEADARAEGARECDPVSGREVLLAGASQRGSFVLHYRDIWEQINGPGSWDANPWVWVVEFRKVKP